MGWVEKHLEAALIAVAALLAPTAPVLLATGTLVSLDLLLGISVALKKNRRITSRKLSSTVHKLLIYGLLIVVARMLEVMTFDAVPFVKLAASSLALTEGTSILENLSLLGGKRAAKRMLYLLKSRGDKR